MLLLASAPKHALRRNDLGNSGKLQFRVHAREMGKEQLQVLDADLNLFVSHKTKAAGPLSNGHQTMVIGGVYTVGGRSIMYALIAAKGGPTNAAASVTVTWAVPHWCTEYQLLQRATLPVGQLKECSRHW